jgi:hypothetical protein
MKGETKKERKKKRNLPIKSKELKRNMKLKMK